MCSVLAGLTALGGVMQYQSQQAAADAQAQAYENQARAAERNAQIEGRKQEQIADNYARQSDDLRQRQRLIQGQNRAQAGAAGLGMAGSALDILSSGYDAYNQDKETLLSNQRNDNFNSRVTQSNFINERNSALSAAANTRAVAKAQGMATILGTAASIYGNIGSGGSSAGSSASSGGAASSITSKVGTNTTANWSMGSGYSFNPTNSLGQWSKGFNMGNFGQKNYFGYTKGR